MAITISKYPQLISPAGNPLMWQFSSTNSTQPNFSYIVEVYLNNIKISTNKVLPEIGGNTAHFDGSAIIQPWLTIPGISTPIYRQNPSALPIRVEILESYGATPTTSNRKVGDTTYTWNACLSNEEFVNYDYNDWLGNKFFTDNRSAVFHVNKNTDLPISFMVTDEFVFDVVLLDAQGNQIDFISLQEPSEMLIVDVNLSKQNLEDNGITEYDNASYIELRINSFETITYKFVNNCFEENNSLVFLNKYGGFDVFALTHSIEKNTSIKTHDFERQFGKWVGDSYEYDTEDSGAQVYLKVMEDSGVIHSQSLPEAIANWLLSINESPRVMLWENGNKRRINITNTKYSKIQERYSDDLIMVSFDFDYNNKRKSINL